MARTTTLKASGLDLVDRLYRNQILVDLVFSTDDRKILKSIAGRSRGMLAAAGLEGLSLERAMHFALAGLEFLSANDVDDLARRRGLPEAGRPEGVTQAQCDGVRQHNRDLFLATLLAFAGNTRGDTQPIVDVMNALAEECRAAPAAVRHRLAERVFAIEFSNAPLEVLTWLARMEVVVSRKFEGGGTLMHSLDPVSIRAASLWELDAMRIAMLRTSKADPGHLLHKLMTMDPQFASRDGVLRLGSLLERVEKMTRSGTDGRVSWLVLLHARWQDAAYIRETFKQLHQLAPYLRINPGDQGTVISNIAAAKIEWSARHDDSRARFAAKSSAATHAVIVAETLEKHGFTLDPHTLHRRKGAVEAAIKSMGRYYELAKSLDVAFPAEYPDVHQIIQAVKPA